MISILKYYQFVNEMAVSDDEDFWNDDEWWKHPNFEKLKYNLDDFVIYKGCRAKIVRKVPNSIKPYQIQHIKNRTTYLWVSEDEITIDTSTSTSSVKGEIDDKIRWWRNGKLEESSEN